MQNICSITRNSKTCEMRSFSSVSGKSSMIGHYTYQERYRENRDNSGWNETNVKSTISGDTRSLYFLPGSIAAWSLFEKKEAKVEEERTGENLVRLEGMNFCMYQQ